MVNYMAVDTVLDFQKRMIKRRIAHASQFGNCSLTSVTHRDNFIVDSESWEGCEDALREMWVGKRGVVHQNTTR